MEETGSESKQDLTDALNINGCSSAQNEQRPADLCETYFKSEKLSPKGEY